MRISCCVMWTEKSTSLIAATGDNSATTSAIHPAAKAPICHGRTPHPRPARDQSRETPDTYSAALAIRHASDIGSKTQWLMSVAGTVDRRGDHQRENGDGADRRQHHTADRHEAAVRRTSVREPFAFRPTRRAGRRRRHQARSHEEIQHPSVPGFADRARREKAEPLTDNPRQHRRKGQDPEHHVFALDPVRRGFCRGQWSLGTRKTTAYSGIQVTTMKYQKTPSSRASR